MKRIVKLLAAAVLSAVLLALYPGAYALSPSDLTGEAAILIDRSTGQILFEKNAYVRMYPASTTKIMTALLVLENLSLSEIVTVGDEPPYVGGSHIALDTGEQLTVEQLLYGLMVASGNDCAAALAIHMCGSQEEFAVKMTERAHEIGALSTHYANPHGLHDPEHYTTAYDLSLIANEAMNNEVFRRLVSTTRYEIPPTNKKADSRFLNNTNSLWPGLRGSDASITVDGKPDRVAYDLVTGVKTGYTEEAGRCLVSSAMKNDREVLAVVLFSELTGVYQDSKNLLVYGLEKTQPYAYYAAGEVLDRIRLDNPRKTELRLVPKDSVTLVLPVDSPADAVRFQIEQTVSAELPISTDEVLARLVAYYEDQVIRSFPLYSDVDVAGEDLIDAEITRHKPPARIPYLRIGVNILLLLFLWRLVNTIAFVHFGYKRKKQRTRQKESA